MKTLCYFCADPAPGCASDLSLHMIIVVRLRYCP